eukprot:scaffold55349_cov22-Tisochrysis_lutea.AAC.1
MRMPRSSAAADVGGASRVVAAAAASPKLLSPLTGGSRMRAPDAVSVITVAAAAVALLIWELAEEAGERDRLRRGRFWRPGTSSSAKQDRA